MVAKRKNIDWEAVEIQYRAGIRSLKDIGSQYGVSDAGIIKRAKRDGWVRDLKAKIRAKAEAKVSASMVSGEVSENKKIAEAEIVEVESTVQARIQISHRADIQKARKLVMELIAELELTTSGRELLEQLAEIVAKDDSKRYQTIMKAVGLTGRAATMGKLADALRTLIQLEREAFGIDGSRGSTLEERPVEERVASYIQEPPEVQKLRLIYG